MRAVAVGIQAGNGFCCFGRKRGFLAVVTPFFWKTGIGKITGRDETVLMDRRIISEAV